MLTVLTLLLLTSALSPGSSQSSPAHRIDQQKPAKDDNHAAKDSAVPASCSCLAVEACKEKQDAAKKDNEGRSKPTYWDKVRSPDTLPNWILMGVGIIGTILAIITLIYIGGQAKDASTALGHTQMSAEAAKISADAALLNAQAIINSERAWVTAGLEWVVGNTYAMNLTNHGRTPAYVIGYHVFVACPPVTPSISKFPETHQITSFGRDLNLFLVSGRTYRVDERFELLEYFGPQIWDEVLAGTKTAIFKIVITYQNLITKDQHSTEIVYSYKQTEFTIVVLPWLSVYK
jgi:hypothetical protein